MNKEEEDRYSAKVEKLKKQKVIVCPICGILRRVCEKCLCGAYACRLVYEAQKKK